MDLKYQPKFDLELRGVEQPTSHSPTREWPAPFVRLPLERVPAPAPSAAIAVASLPGNELRRVNRKKHFLNSSMSNEVAFLPGL
jgi:hypothetical protein